MVYLSFSHLPLASLLFSAVWKASSENHFAFLHFFFLGMVLITASRTMLQTSVHSSSGTLSIRSNPLNHLSLLLYNHKGFHLQSCGFPYFLQFKAEFCSKGKTRDTFKKIRDTQGTFHAKMGTIKDRNGMDLTEAEVDSYSSSKI